MECFGRWWSEPGEWARTAPTVPNIPRLGSSRMNRANPTARFKELYESSQLAPKAEGKLAAVPAEISQFSQALESYHERPIQAELTDVLLLESDDSRWTSCVVVHGMGGTGKTVTAVAAVQDSAVRRHMSEIYWLTVGADVVGDKIRQLQAILCRLSVHVMAQHL